jgi:hypothetical protein
VFYYKFFADKVKCSKKLEAIDSVIDADEVEEDLIWEAMSKSAGVDTIGDDDSDADSYVEDEKFISDESEEFDGGLLIDEENSSTMDEYESSDSEEKQKKPKTPRRLQRFSKIAADLGYKGDYFANQDGDFASAEDFEEVLNKELVEELDDAPSIKRKTDHKFKKSKRIKNS